MIGIQPEACLTPFLAGGILDDIFNREIDNGFLHTFPRDRRPLSAAVKKFQKISFLLYFTLPGLVHLCPHRDWWKRFLRSFTVL